ncbi:hypothetical protein YPPY46_3162, partial [Yersinia pestis PY-46]
MAISSQRVAA